MPRPEAIGMSAVADHAMSLEDIAALPLRGWRRQ